MDFTTLMEKVEQANGRALPDECHGLIADYVGEKISPQLRMQNRLDAVQALYERFKHLDPAFRLLSDDRLKPAPSRRASARADKAGFSTA